MGALFFEPRGIAALTPSGSPSGPALDARLRPLKDLRLSVIDQCNFRCTYCMPADVYTKDYPFLKASQRLSFEQMLTMATAFVELGVEKIRITGGEPLLRKGLEGLIASLARLTTLDGKPLEIALTTNGSLLAARAKGLRDAGLQRVTVSLDSLDDAIFQRMNGVGFPVAKVLEGIEAAVAAGLRPVKVNAMIENGVNDNQILPLVRHFRHSGVALRFIEFMDVGGAESWSRDSVLNSAEIQRRVESEFPLVAAAGRAQDTARVFRHADGGGDLGFISSVSEPFCGACTRARVSVEGKLFTCLFATESLDLRPYLGNGVGSGMGSGASAGQLADVLRAHWSRRGDRYSELRSELRDERAASGKKSYPTVRMSLVGG
jgi:cyclic pyranopterin phosphate synthase